jgi:hypothetical protein
VRGKRPRLELGTSRSTFLIPRAGLNITRRHLYTPSLSLPLVLKRVPALAQLPLLDALFEPPKLLTGRFLASRAPLRTVMNAVAYTAIGLPNLARDAHVSECAALPLLCADGCSACDWCDCAVSNTLHTAGGAGGVLISCRVCSVRSAPYIPVSMMKAQGTVMRVRAIAAADM